MLDRRAKERKNALTQRSAGDQTEIMRETDEQYVEREKKREQFRRDALDRMGQLPIHWPAPHRRGSRQLAGQARSGYAGRRFQMPSLMRCEGLTPLAAPGKASP
jgi:hypothetical protein